MPDPLHPHAVKSAGAKQFVHDAVGNQIERLNESITYTDWDLPPQYIPKGAGIPTTFEYSGTGQRVRRIRGESETIYLGDLYEQETNGNTVTNRFYVHNDERVVAIVERAASGELQRSPKRTHFCSPKRTHLAISNWRAPTAPRRLADPLTCPYH